MTKLKAILAAAVLVAGVGTSLFLQHRANNSLRARNEALLLQVSQLSELEAENQRLSKRLFPAPNNSNSDEPKLELARLRGELTRLRAEAYQTEKLRQEIDRLRSARVESATTQAQNAIEQDNLPRETWTFAGFGSPDSTIQSSSWAGLQGDLETFFNNMAPDEQARIRKEWEIHGKGEAQIRDFLVSYWGQTKAIRIEERQALSDNEVILSLFIERENGRSLREKMKLRRIDNEWKIAGPQESAEEFEIAK